MMMAQLYRLSLDDACIFAESHGKIIRYCSLNLSLYFDTCDCVNRPRECGFLLGVGIGATILIKQPSSQVQ